MGPHKYEDVVLSVSGQIGTIKLNRPKSLNAFGGNLMLDIVAALRELNEHPQTVFTVITGEGRFVSDPRVWAVDGTAYFATLVRRRTSVLGIVNPASLSNPIRHPA